MLKVFAGVVAALGMAGAAEAQTLRTSSCPPPQSRTTNFGQGGQAPAPWQACPASCPHGRGRAQGWLQQHAHTRVHAA